MINSEAVKRILGDLGADLCGIAPARRFDGAPEGFRPNDIYKACRSVIVFAKRLPGSVLSATSCVPYTQVNTIMAWEVDRLALEASLELEGRGLSAIPIPSDDPYEHWEPERTYGRAILSMRHGGHLAGLGVLGKNTLLINDRFGNMIQVGAILTDADLEGDPIADYEACAEDCTLCLDACPQGALDGTTVDQYLCRPLACHRNERGFIVKKCSLCRSICPSFRGIAGSHPDHGPA
jgi:epoxyqueuosine reductase